MNEVHKYKKLPTIVQAVQYKGTLVSLGVIKSFVGDSLIRTPIGYGIKTLEGVMDITDDDYIIKGIKGEFYPCKPDIFEATYAMEYE